jgi:hypothetical protein
MITYKLNLDKTFAERLEDNVRTGVWCNVETNQEYLEWLKEGNKPKPADPIPSPKKLTLEEKLARFGITAEELKNLLK